MGVTIHYRGTIANPARAEALVKAASAIAAEMKWKVEILETPYAGLTIFPHPDCEPLLLTQIQTDSLKTGSRLSSPVQKFMSKS
jgi:hypothetical protein